MTRSPWAPPWTGRARRTSCVGAACAHPQPRDWLHLSGVKLIGDLSVLENVELPLTYRTMPAPERPKRAIEALDRVGMAHRMNHYPSQLSGGQQQRVAVTRAIGGKPSILLADAPTGNLDSTNGEAATRSTPGVPCTCSTARSCVTSPALWLPYRSPMVSSVPERASARVPGALGALRTSRLLSRNDNAPPFGTRRPDAPEVIRVPYADENELFALVQDRRPAARVDGNAAVPADALPDPGLRIFRV